MSATISLCPSPPSPAAVFNPYPRDIIPGYCLLRSWGAEMYLANGDTSRRGTINLCQKHRSGQCGGATTRAVPRFVAGNCLSARETSRWNFRPLRHRQFRFRLREFWKFFFSIRERTDSKESRESRILEEFENRCEIFQGDSEIFFFFFFKNREGISISVRN